MVTFGRQGNTRFRPLSRVIAAVLFVTAIGCTSASELRDGDCTISANLVPSCGVLWGFSPRGGDANDLARAQETLGRQFDVVYRFHDLNDTIPDANERRLTSHGTILHVSIDARDFARPDRTITWRSVAEGQFDTALRGQARGIASLGVPVFVTFEHEADQPVKGALGSTNDFVAAWRHVHQVYNDAGATNAVWVWVVLGWDQTYERAASMWPGNNQVDWISWDVYNASGCRRGRVDPSEYESFAEGVLSFYRWIHAYGGQYDIDTTKPMMISEAASVSYASQPEKSAGWYEQIPSVLRKYPQVMAVSLWTNVGNAACDYRFENNDIITDGVRRASMSPLVNPLTAQARPRR